MLSDVRIKKLANVLVDYSVSCEKGDKVWIDYTGCDYQLVAEIIREVYAHGGMPFVFQSDARVKREILKGCTDEMLKVWAKRDALPNSVELKSKLSCSGDFVQINSLVLPLLVFVTIA